MKKFKILALVMTCAILLSSIIIPVSATGAGVTGAAITIDGKADNGEWDNPTATYQLSDHIKTEADGNYQIDNTPATAKFSYDNEYLYIYYETTNEDTLSNKDSSGRESIYIQIFPKDGDLYDANCSNNGETVLLRVKYGNGLDSLTPSSSTGTTKTYVWQGTDASTNSYLIGQFSYSKTSSYAVTGTWYENTVVAVTVTYDGDTITKKSVEVKYPLADSYKNALTTANGADLKIALWEKAYRYKGEAIDNGGYTIAPNTYGWNGEYGVDLNLPGTGNTDATYKATKVDGTMAIDGSDNDAGWSENALFTMSFNCPGPDKNNVTLNTGNSTVKVKYDANYIYFYFESTNAGTATGHADGSNRESLYLRIMPTNRDIADANNTANGETLHARIYYKPGTSYTWNGANDSLDSGTDKVKYINYNSNTSGTKYAKGDGFYENTIVSANSTDGKVTVEMRFPLAECYKTALQTADGATLRLGFYEKSCVYNGVQDSNGTAGYVVPGFTYGTNANGITLNLPKLGKTAPVLVGFQSRTNENDNTKYDVRFVSVVDNYDGFDFATSKLGYLFNNGTKDSEAKYCYSVYETLSYTKTDGSTGTLSATDFGGKYFFCFTVTGMDPAATYNWTVKCFTQKDAESTVEYCQNPVTVKITYAEGKAVFTY